ncbi:hypothetical protein HC762_01670 [bacterium]|nr:hypothetical protein [bacterium]
MAEPEIEIAASAEPDVEMDEETAGDENGHDPVGVTKPDRPNVQTVFLDYLRSPVVELMIGKGDDATMVTAHQALLTPSPFFAEKLADLPGDRQRLDMPEESLDAIGCFLQYQYTGEYFPRRVPTNPDGLEIDPSVPAVDDTGAQLLKHARVYTLAEKLGLPELKTLAHSKIHWINSTAVGEIAYARYVYGNTPSTDVTIRRPVAAFWATRSHVLRHDAEDEFRTMCLEYPQFGFDVLSLVLDQREKRSTARDEETPVKGSSRKRMRLSVHV